MSIEALLWGLLPTAISLGAVGVSWRIVFKARRVLHFIASGVVVVVVAWSLLMLYAVFVRGAWPSYLPHLAIVAVLAIVAAQMLLFKRQTQAE
jgi:hypothetical protein